MRRSKETGFMKFSDIANNIHKIPIATQGLRDNLFVFFLSHSETVQDAEGNQKFKAKTCGKLIDNVITYEGMFTIVLFAEKRIVKDTITYGFVTNGDVKSTAKSPRGMFEKDFIPNDLSIVIDGIKKYEM